MKFISSHVPFILNLTVKNFIKVLTRLTTKIYWLPLWHTCSYGCCLLHHVGQALKRMARKPQI